MSLSASTRSGSIARKTTRRVRVCNMRTACASAIITLSLAGCGGGGHERFFPSEPAARDALRQVLEQWQRREAPAGIPTAPVRTEPADSHPKPGQRVLHF